MAHRYTYAPPCCRTWEYFRTFIPLSVSLWNDLANPVFDVVGLATFKSRASAFLFVSALFLYAFYYFSISLLSVNRLVLWGLGLCTDRV